MLYTLFSCFFFSSRRRHTRWPRDWSSDVCSSDLPGVGPEHSYLKTTNRAQYHAVSGSEALEAFQVLSETEGIIPALESAHAISYAMKYAATLNHDDIVIINLSGRGDKDVEQVFDMLKK